MKALVNTLLIGAQKAGTTSLYHYMSQHPDVTHSKVKELTYFIDKSTYDEGVDALHCWFPKNVDTNVVSSGHVHMLVSDSAPARVQQYNPDMRFVLVLRDPAERAWSAYRYAVANGWQDPSVDFLTALRDGTGDLTGNIARTRHDTAYVRNGMYGQHLRRWTNNFDRSQFHLIRSNDLRVDASSELSELFRFLGISTDVRIDTSTEHNRARVFRWRSIASLIHNRDSRIKKALRQLVPVRGRAMIRGSVLPMINKANEIPLESSPIPSAAAEMLCEIYADDAELLREEFDFEF